jgi:hypothetical protein
VQSAALAYGLMMGNQIDAGVTTDIELMPWNILTERIIAIMIKVGRSSKCT